MDERTSASVENLSIDQSSFAYVIVVCKRIVFICSSLKNDKKTIKQHSGCRSHPVSFRARTIPQRWRQINQVPRTEKSGWARTNGRGGKQRIRRSSFIGSAIATSFSLHDPESAGMQPGQSARGSGR